MSNPATPYGLRLLSAGFAGFGGGGLCDPVYGESVYSIQPLTNAGLPVVVSWVPTPRPFSRSPARG